MVSRMAEPIDTAIAHFDAFIVDPARLKPMTAEWFMAQGAAHACSMLRTAKATGLHESPVSMQAFRQRMKVEAKE